MKGKLYRITDDQLYMIKAALSNQADRMRSYGESGEAYIDLISRMESGDCCCEVNKSWEDHDKE